LLFAARTVEEYTRTRANLRAGFEWLATDDEEWARATDVQHELAKRGQLRAVKRLFSTKRGDRAATRLPA
jgi:hypothetical protein